MQISAESVKFCFYTEHAPKSDRESGLNLSFDKKKDRLALGFLKCLVGFTSPQIQSADIKFAFIY